MTNFTFDRIHSRVYEEILCGRFRPDAERFNDLEEPVNLVLEANSYKVATLEPEDTLLEFIDKHDFKCLGYKENKDFEIHTKTLNSGRIEVYLRPVKIYELKETIDIPLLSTIKNNCFLQLISDQFERIKIRAEYALENELNDANLTSYAIRNIQKAKKLFYDGKIFLKELQHKQDPEDIYIIFILNIFLIRTILFFEKMFKPYISQEQPDREEQMKMELHACLSLSRISHIFQLTETGICGMLKKSKCGMTDCSAAEPADKCAQSEKTFLDDVQHHDFTVNSGMDSLQNLTGLPKTFLNGKPMTANKGDACYSKMKWNGQINVLVDIFLQCIEEQRASGVPLLETSYEDLKNFLLANFTDKKGNDLSYHTINTILDAKRFDKRLHPESPKRVDVAKIMKR